MPRPDEQLYWTPIEWRCGSFPRPDEETEYADMNWLVERLESLVQMTTEADYTPMQRALHPAHILVTLQGSDGQWPAQINMVTGEALTPTRTSLPVRLFRMLRERLSSSEFSVAIAHAESLVEGNGVQNGDGPP